MDTEDARIYLATWDEDVTDDEVSAMSDHRAVARAVQHYERHVGRLPED